MAKTKTERKKGHVRIDTIGHIHDRETADGSDGEPKEQMCCDGSGRTAEEHRKESADGKCCVDE